MSRARALETAERVVIKIGSSSLTRQDGGLDRDRITAIASLVSDLRQRGKLVVVVSSGSIAAGISPLSMKRRPRDLSGQQAAAAVGQGMLILQWTQALASHGLVAGQVLLTLDDLTRKTNYGNALRTMSRLLHLGAVPIVNENDTVATAEIRFGDNDRLAALVAHLVRADVLALLTDVEALYTAHPSSPDAQRIAEVRDFDSLSADTSHRGSHIGSGGMASKLDAAHIATSGGTAVLVGAAEQAHELLAGEDVGTFFPQRAPRRRRRLLWLAHASSTLGSVTIDSGAVQALEGGSASLLPAGVVSVAGDFAAGDPIDVYSANGRVVARGLCRFASGEISSILGYSTTDLPAELASVVIHRDELVLLRRDDG